MQAFELTEEAKEAGFSGGTVMCSPAGHTFDVKQALDANDGVIVSDSPLLVPLLSAYEALQATDVPEGAKPVQVPGYSQTTAESIKAPPFTPQLGEFGRVDPPSPESIPAAAEAPSGEEDIPNEQASGEQTGSEEGSTARESSAGQSPTSSLSRPQFGSGK